jgi:dCMP deaminase
MKMGERTFQETSDRRKKLVGWMRVALTIAQHSRCKRAQYGTVILDAGGRVVTTGFNGKPAGSCNDDVCYREDLPANSGGVRRKCCLHSEQNALVFGNFSEYRGGTIIVSGMPCEDCALLIMQSGVKTLVCMEDPRDYKTLEVLAEYGAKMEIVQLTRREVMSVFAQIDEASKDLDEVIKDLKVASEGEPPLLCKDLAAQLDSLGVTWP